MAFCYLHVVSHGLTRVILPEPILDRSGIFSVAERYSSIVGFAALG